MVGMYHTRELFNKELKLDNDDNATNEWFDRIYK
jgi:hypothetical protein